VRRAAGPRLVVLIVDDDPGDVLLIHEALEAVGRPRSIHIARDGREALAFLRRHGEHGGAERPDLVLLDLNMPGMHGRQVLAELKADPDLGRIPVLVFTTSRDPSDIAAAYALHANAFVTKPTGLEDFTAVVAGIDEFFSQTVTLPISR
jgi:CheY-like chemotaxis protein